MKISVCFLLIALLLTGCHAGSPDNSEAVATLPEETGLATLPAAMQTQEPVLPSFSYDDLAYETFYFSSGAGSWYTELIIRSDGSFTGEYYNHDNDADTAYPEGTVYLCSFSGQFSQPERVNAHTFSARLLELRYDNPDESEQIRDRQRYIRTEAAVGVEGGTEFHFYLPDATFAQLPEGYQSWVTPSGEDTVLGCYGLYNLTAENGFRSINLLDDIRDRVSRAELDEAYWENTANDPNATQADINIAAQYRYELWDGVINRLWGVLKQVLDKEAMKELTDTQLQWIAEKEQAMADAGAELQGGSLTPTAVYGTGAAMTRQRVYELLELLP